MNNPNGDQTWFLSKHGQEINNNSYGYQKYPKKILALPNGNEALHVKKTNY